MYRIPDALTMNQERKKLQMSSMLSTTKCSQCNHECMTVEDDCRTFEQWGFCPACGNSYSRTFRKDLSAYIDEQRDGCGVCAIAHKDGFVDVRPYEENEYCSMHQLFFKNLENDEVDRDNSFLTQWNSEKGQLDVIYKGKKVEEF